MKGVAKAKKNEKPSAPPKGRRFTIEDLWEELKGVRKALEKSERRAKRLELRVAELEAENKKLRRKRLETEDFLQGKIRKLEKDVADRDRQLEKTKKQLAWFNKTFFDETSEKLEPEPEKKSPSGDEPPEEQDSKTGKRKRGQQPGSKGHGRTDRGNIPIADTITIEIPGGCSCPDCGKSYRILSVTRDTDLFDIAIDLVRTIYKQLKYVSQCDCRGKRIVEAPAPERLYSRTDIGNSLWVHLIVQKFLQGCPINRTLKELSLWGFSLAEGTVTGGCKIIDDLLTPLNDAIVNHCRGAKYWNADETTWRVFDSNKTRWWLWVVASNDAVAYVLDPSRSKKVPTEFFAGSAGTLMTDRLASYKSLQDSISKAWCWVHQRRDFLKIYNGVKSLKRWSRAWLDQITKLFLLYSTRHKLWIEARDRAPEWERAQKELVEHVKKLEQRWKRQLRQTGLHDEQKKVLRSMKRHWEGLTLFLEDPWVPLHNNRAERLLRNAVIVRKNSFGSGADWAGSLAAKVFSLLQTWLINGLDPQALLLDYFNECSKTPGRAPPDISQFLPWAMSQERKQCFALPASYKRPG
ncbi:MAG: Transposase IS66 family protein [Candidatus Methanoperedens nitroreducens]|uniref:Transposase IS66 family protein n=1 Tax=Candidatus Methanoperedens nitratireducens TaxID=1392998 RepID=A0A0P8E461_9EURY|nr:MAG: Transposase IS66 family protein [Candidatus Methanoperedens sp. BLZ1]